MGPHPAVFRTPGNGATVHKPGAVFLLAAPRTPERIDPSDSYRTQHRHGV